MSDYKQSVKPEEPVKATFTRQKRIQANPIVPANQSIVPAKTETVVETKSESKEKIEKGK